MVVLNGGGSPTMHSTHGQRSQHRYSPYVQPLPTEYDSKNSPLAMLTKTCHKIESDLISNSNRSATIHKTNFDSPAASSSTKPASPKQSSRPKSNSSNSSSSSTRSNTPIELRLKPTSSHSPDSSHQPKTPSTETPLRATLPPQLPMFTPPSSSSPTTNPSSVPPPQSPICTDPLCRDPTCPTFMYRNMQLMASHQAYLNAISARPPTGSPLMPNAANPFMYPGLFSPMSIPGLSDNQTSSSSSSPFICNWMQGSECCGRRFSTSEDLMSHLRSHTNSIANATMSSQNDSAMSSALQALYRYPPMGPSNSALAALQAHAARSANGSTSPRTTSTSAVTSTLAYNPYLPSITTTAGSLLPFLPPHLSAPFPSLPFAQGGGANASAHYPPLHHPLLYP